MGGTRCCIENTVFLNINIITSLASTLKNFSNKISYRCSYMKHWLLISIYYFQVDSKTFFCTLRITIQKRKKYNWYFISFRKEIIRNIKASYGWKNSQGSRNDSALAIANQLSLLILAIYGPSRGAHSIAGIGRAESRASERAFAYR